MTFAPAERMRSWARGAGIAVALVGLTAAVEPAELPDHDVAALVDVAHARTPPRTSIFRHQLEAEYKDRPEYLRAIRERAFSVRIPEARPKGSEWQTLKHALSYLASHCHERHIVPECHVALTEVDVPTIARDMEVRDVGVASRAMQNLARGGACFRIYRWERAARYDHEGWAAYDRIYAKQIEAGKEPKKARQIATRQAGVRWRQRSTLTVVLARPVAYWKAGPGLQPGDILALALKFQHEPNKLAAILPVYDRKKRDEAAGISWSPGQLRSECDAAIDAYAKRWRAGRPRTKEREAPAGVATPNDAPPGAGKTPKSTPAEIADYRTVAEVFTQVRRRDRRYHDDELVGEARRKDQVEIGRQMRAWARGLCAESGESPEEKVLRELSELVTLEYLRLDGSNGSFLVERKHQITFLHGDLAEAGEAALKEWRRRRAKPRQRADAERLAEAQRLLNEREAAARAEALRRSIFAGEAIPPEAFPTPRGFNLPPPAPESPASDPADDPAAIADVCAAFRDATSHGQGGALAEVMGEGAARSRGS